MTLPLNKYIDQRFSIYALKHATAVIIDSPDLKYRYPSPERLTIRSIYTEELSKNTNTLMDRMTPRMAIIEIAIGRSIVLVLELLMIINARICGGFVARNERKNRPSHVVADATCAC